MEGKHIICVQEWCSWKTGTTMAKVSG